FTTYLLPCAGATSGSTNYKYALNTSLGSGTPVTVSSTANPLTISKTSDHSLYGLSTSAIFTVTVHNPGSFGITIDKITDEIPAGFTFQSIHGTSNVTALNSTSVPAAGATGTITFDGGVVSGPNTSYFIAAGQSLILRYTATTASSNAFNLLTTARGFVATTQIGSAQNTVSASNTLPVTILSFRASEQADLVKLDWTTTNEINSDVFEVERNNGSGFRKIGVVNATGASSIVNNYNFVDSFALPGKNQYRLKAVDKDQQYKYSTVLAVDRKNNGLVIRSIYPNPFKENINIRLFADKKQDLVIQLTDINGRVVLKQTRSCTQGATEIIIPVQPNLNAGVYFLELATGDNSLQRIKLVRAAE
ncbi:MAG TPA: T9SS type A sorting domain-containing protein, partial [Chitinophagaceae bacterium]